MSHHHVNGLSIAYTGKQDLLQLSSLQDCNIVWTYLKLTFFFPPQTKENDELTKICDDLILKMEKN